MAKALVQNLAAEWKPEKYTDEYRENLMRVIQAKAKGKKIKIHVPEEPRQAEVVNLMERLRQSLAGKTPEGPKAAVRRGRKPSRATRSRSGEPHSVTSRAPLHSTALESHRRCSACPSSAAATIASRRVRTLQTALINAQPGIPSRYPCATYPAISRLPKKGGSSFITLKPKRSTARRRFAISPAQHPVSPSSDRPTISRPCKRRGCAHWRITLSEFQANRTAKRHHTLGDGSRSQNALSQVPHDLVVDRCYIHGDPSRVRTRHALNSASTP